MGETEGLVLMGRAMLSKFLIQFSVEGRGCVPSLLFALISNYGGGNEEWRPPSKVAMHALLHSVPLTLQQAIASTRFCRRPLDTHRQVWVSLLWGHCSLLLGPGAQGSVCALPESVSPVLCKFWWLYGGVNGNLLQVGLCHTQVYCTRVLAPAVHC